jgi:hypothetical protein
LNWKTFEARKGRNGSVQPGRVTDADQQTVGGQQAGDDLLPGLGAASAKRANHIITFFDRIARSGHKHGRMLAKLTPV